MKVKAANTGHAVKAAYFNERVAYKSIAGINKLCAQCLKECKQSARVKVVYCPFFIMRYRGSVNNNKPKEVWSTL